MEGTSNSHYLCTALEQKTEVKSYHQGGKLNVLNNDNITITC